MSDPDVQRSFQSIDHLLPMEHKMSIFQIAWGLLQERIEAKTGWGKNELKTLMSECLQEAVAEHENA